MTKAKLAFVHCRLGCLSCRPVCFFPRLFPFACLLLFACRRFRCPALGPAGFSPRRIFRHRLIVFSFPPSGSFLSVFFLLPVRCCSPVVVFAVRHWDLPAFPRGGFFAIVLLSFPSRRPVRFFPSFSFCRSVVVRLSSFSLSGIGTCRLFPAADFSPSSYCLFLPAVRFVSFRLFPFAGPLLFACRRFRCPALGPAGFSPRRIFRHRLIVFSFPPSGSFLSVFFLLPVRCCSPVVVFAVRHWDLPAFPRGGFFAIVLLSFPSRRPVRFFPSFPFCLSVVVRLSSFSLSGNWDLPAFPRGGFFASGLLSFPSRRPVRFFPSFSFCRYFPSLFAFSFVAFCI